MGLVRDFGPRAVAFAAINPNDEVTVFDPKLGMIKRRRADVERQFARSRDDAVIEEVRRAQVDCDQFVVLICGGLAQRRPMVDPRTVDQDVDI